MATVLNKSVIRESTETVDEKNVIVTLTEDQEINFRLKGSRSKGESIGILELFNMLYGEDTASSTPSKDSDGAMINLHDLRNQNAISTLDYEAKVKFEEIIVNLLDTMRS